MPKLLCSKCVGRAKIAHDFRKQAISTDTHLKSLISQFTKQLNQGLKIETIGSDSEDFIESDNDPEQDVEPDRSHQLEESIQQENFDNNDKIVDSEIKNDDNGDIIGEVEMLDHDTNFDEDDAIIYEEQDEIESNKDMDVINTHYEVSNSVDFNEITQYDESGLTNEFHAEIITDDTGVEMNEENAEAYYVLENDQNIETDDNVTYSSNADLSEMKNDFEFPKLHNCEKCNKTFSTKTNLVRHLLTHDGNKPYQCELCFQRFTQNGSLKQHMLLHSGEKPYVCAVCNRGFTQAKSLTFHMRRHTGEKPFTCDQCGQAFRQRDGLKRHIFMRHSESDAKGHTCPFCQKILFSKFTLKMHMKKHTGEDEIYKCDTCHKGFSSKASLENHLRQHTGEKPFVCEECKKPFAQKGSLVAHMKMHLSVKPFECEICNKGFTQNHQLVAHMNVHQNQTQKRFKCHICTSSFSVKYVCFIFFFNNFIIISNHFFRRNLFLHLKTHADNDTLISFKCEDCNIIFNSSRGLKQHRNAQHKGDDNQIYTCNQCDSCFTCPVNFEDHINEHDQIDVKCDICGAQYFSSKLYSEHLLEHED